MDDAVRVGQEEETKVMSRGVCLAIVLASLAAAPGCTSCFGGNSCRRPSFMEFRSPCSRGAGGCQDAGPAPCQPACGPAHDGGCGSGCGSGCGEATGGMAVPGSAPVVMDQGTFS